MRRPAALSYTRFENTDADARAEWGIGDYLPGGGCETGEIALVLLAGGVQVRAFADGRAVLARFLETPVLAECDLALVGEHYVEQVLDQHLERTNRTQEATR